MPVEGSPDLVQALLGELSKALKEPITRYCPDLLAERFAVMAQPALSGWNLNLKGKDPLHAGRDRNDGDGRARTVRQIVLNDDRWTRLADLRPDDWIQIYQEDIPTPDHNPSTSKLDHSESRDEAAASVR
jgi:hypothetical protein